MSDYDRYQENRLADLQDEFTRLNKEIERWKDSVTALARLIDAIEEIVDDCCMEEYRAIKHAAHLETLTQEEYFYIQ